MKFTKAAKNIYEGIFWPYRAIIKLFQFLEETVAGWMELAPYHMALMASSFSTTSLVGTSSFLSSEHSSRPDEHFSRRIFEHLPEPRKSEMIAWHALSLERARRGRWHRYCGYRWMSLADHYASNEGGHAAKKYLETALTVFRKVECRDEYFLRCLEKLAECDRACGKLDESINRLLEAVELRETNLLMLFSPSSGEISLQSQSEGLKSYRRSLSRVYALLKQVLLEDGDLESALKIMSRMLELLEYGGGPSLARAGDFERRQEIVMLCREMSKVSEELDLDKERRLYKGMAEALEWLSMFLDSSGGNSLRESALLGKELRVLRDCYRERGKIEIERYLCEWIEIIDLHEKIRSGSGMNLRRNILRLAECLENRDEPGDATEAFHLRARLKRMDAKITKR